MKEIFLIKADNGVGYAVFINRDGKTNLCILPYSERYEADEIKNAYMRIGYNYKGCKHEVDMK